MLGIDRAGRDDPRDSRGFSMIRRRFLAAIPFGLGARSALAAPGSGDPRFPALIATRVGGKPVRLSLTGSALRTKYRFHVYSVASYLKEGVAVRTPEGLAGLDAPKILHLIFERDVDGATMAKAYRESIGRSYPAPAFAAELALLEAHFLANPVRQGDHIWLTHVPGVGLAVNVNNQPGLMVGGVAFARAAWGTYLGPNNIGMAIKSGLTSRL
jgi:hypothetical protein